MDEKLKNREKEIQADIELFEDLCSTKPIKRSPILEKTLNTPKPIPPIPPKKNKPPKIIKQVKKKVIHNDEDDIEYSEYLHIEDRY